MTRSKIFLASSATLLAIAGFAAKKAQRFQSIQACYYQGSTCKTYGVAANATTAVLLPAQKLKTTTANFVTLYQRVTSPEILPCDQTSGCIKTLYIGG